MAFKTFAPGVLTSSDVNTFLMRQAVITCTSSTRPASPSEGMTIYETDTDTILTYSGSAWESVAFTGAWDSYTPTLASFGTGTDWALGSGTATGRYAKFGRLVVGRTRVTFAADSTFGTKFLSVSAPVTAQATGNEQARGSVWLLDDSTGNPYVGTVSYSGNNFALYCYSVSATFALYDGVDSTAPFTWQTGDTIDISFAYEAAS